ncbi:MAG: hypothetical protein L3J39_14085 [Verrucomicrobiales bacterium]|nr:hypothetical protein [Verrucomicrobiales bacterium]
MKYIKKDIAIEAYEHQSSQGQNWPVDAPDWFHAAIKNGRISQIAGGKLTIKTLEGDHTALDGDFIIQGVRGELYPCRSDIFAETYAQVE